MMGWSVVSRQWSVVGDRWSVIGDRLPITDYRLPDPGLDLLTVVMHELGHLLGYEHAEAGLMCRCWRRARFIPHPSSLVLHPRVVQKPLNHWGKPRGERGGMSTDAFSPWLHPSPFILLLLWTPYSPTWATIPAVPTANRRCWRPRTRTCWPRRRSAPARKRRKPRSRAAAGCSVTNASWTTGSPSWPQPRRPRTNVD